MTLALVPLLAVTFVDVLGFSILIPLLPFYAERFGATPVIVGLLVSTVAFFGFVSSPVLGALSDRLGRKGILLATQVVTTISYVLLAIGGSLPMLFLSRAIEGLSSGGMGVTQAYISDLTQPEQRTQAFAFLGATYGIGFILGPALGGALVRFGYAVPFLTAAAISLLTIVLTIVMLPESHTNPQQLERPLHNLFAALVKPAFRKLLSIQLCFTLAFTMWVSILALFVQRMLGYGPSQTSLLYALAGVIGVIMQIMIVSHLVKAIGERAVLIIGLASGFLAYVFVPAVHSIILMYVLLLFWSLGSALTRPSLSALISHIAVPEQRGALLGAADATNNLAFIIGPLVSTAIFMFKVQYVGIVPSLLLLTGIVFALRLPRLSNDLPLPTMASIS